MINLLRRGLVFALFFVATAALGQDPPPDPTEEDPQVPIPGIWILLVGGAAYGAKKAYAVFRDKRR